MANDPSGSEEAGRSWQPKGAHCEWPLEETMEAKSLITLTGAVNSWSLTKRQVHERQKCPGPVTCGSVTVKLAGEPGLEEENVDFGLDAVLTPRARTDFLPRCCM